MAAGMGDLHLLNRLARMENEVDSLCNELRSPRRRLSATCGGSHKSPVGQTKEPRRTTTPRQNQGMSRSASRGDRQRPMKSASTTSLQRRDQKLQAVLEMPTAAAPRAARIGASREDCSFPLPSKPRCMASPSALSRTLTKSQSTTTAGLGSSSSGSCAALTVASTTPRLTYTRPSEAVSDVHSDWCGSTQQDLYLPRRVQSPRTVLLGVASARSVLLPAERIDLADADASRGDAKRDLVWQLELERLRNATLKLEVQREICEEADLRKRLIETETYGPRHLCLHPKVPTMATISSVSSVTRLASGSLRVPLGSQRSARNLHFTPGLRIGHVTPISPRLK